MGRSRISLWTSCSRPSGLCLGRSWSGFPGSLLGGLRPLGGLLANLVLLACHSLLVGRPLRKKLLWIAPLIVSRFRSLSEGGHRRGPQHVMPATAALLSDAPAPRAAMLSSAARTSKSPSSSRRVLSMYRLSSLWSRGPIPTATRCCLPRHSQPQSLSLAHLRSDCGFCSSLPRFQVFIVHVRAAGSLFAPVTASPRTWPDRMFSSSAPLPK